MANAERVAAVRDFNRFYTRRLGLLRGGLLRTPHPLTEARVLYELGRHETLEVAALRRTLEIDAGQLSRLLARLETNRLVTRERSPQDARRQTIRLTPQGVTVFATLDQRSREEIGALLDALPEPTQHALIQAMRTLEAALRPPTPNTLVIRDPRPGDLGWIVERHGALYAAEYGWDASFERLVAGIMAAFDPVRDHLWVAEVAGERAGCVLCVHESATTAKLRTLLVEPHARGLGAGAQLVEHCVAHARAHGYAELVLWTNDVLTGARRLYERAGFTLTHAVPHHAFGHDLVGQTWSLNL